MLTHSHLTGFNLLPASPVLTFLQATGDDSNQTTYTFAGQNFGAASPTRHIIAAFSWAASGITFSSATIGGVSATSVVGVPQAGTSGALVILIASVPTGSSGTVAITLSGGAVRAGLALYAVTDLQSITATSTSTDTASTAGVSAGSLNVLPGGVVVGIAYSVDDLTGFTWTGLPTRDNTTVLEAGNEFSAAHGTFAVEQTPLSWTATNGATATKHVGAVAAWR